MKDRIILGVSLILASAGPLTAESEGFWWWNEPNIPYTYEGETDPILPTTGSIKALVLVTEFPDDTFTSTYPSFYDTLISSSVSEALSGNYKWNVTNFIYTGSWEQLEITGKVNPGMNGKYVDFM